MPLNNPVETVSIALAERSYPILVGGGLLARAQTYHDVPAAGAALIVTNTTVEPLYAAPLRTALQACFRRVHLVVLPDGEQHKNWQTLNLIFDALLQHRCDRRTVLFALGGGVVGDMTGFAAASFMRGVPFVQVPTTLLAQVDSSVGGKTAINHPLGKNMIGAFYQPAKVVCDLQTLTTLPAREVSAGLAEVIKYGPIADMAFLDWTESHMGALRACEPKAMAHAVKRSCEIKAHVVGQDERESGLRAILNFGHTFGHALEVGSDHGIPHGLAVASGMRAALLFESQTRVLSGVEQQLFDYTSVLVRSVTERWPVSAINWDAYANAFNADKKHGVSNYCLILPNSSGGVRVQHIPKSEAALNNIIDAQKMSLSGATK